MERQSGRLCIKKAPPTDPFAMPSSRPSHHSRRALCDLGRWEEAKRTVGHSLRIQESDEAFSVVRRIKAARPDLYD